MEIISAQRAREQGLRRYFTGQPCKRGHLAERTVSNNSCVVCANAAKSEWLRKHRETRAASRKSGYRIHARYT